MEGCEEDWNCLWRCVGLIWLDSVHAHEHHVGLFVL